MPSLMPGIPGAKEAYGISIIQENCKIKIPPKACKRYGIHKNDLALLITGRKQESGFGLIKKKTAVNTVFKKYLEQLYNPNDIFINNGQSFALVKIIDYYIEMTPEILKAFYLNTSNKLISIKSTTVTIGFNLLEVWIDKMKKHGFNEAIKNTSKLEIF